METVIEDVACPYHCGRMFGTWVQRNRHMLTCDKRPVNTAEYRTEREIRQKRKRVDPVKVECSICGKMLSPDWLPRHKEAHAGRDGKIGGGYNPHAHNCPTCENGGSTSPYHVKDGIVEDWHCITCRQTFVT